MVQNLIISTIPKLLTNPQQTYYYLTYFKLRIVVRHTYGGFSITDELCQLTGLRKRTLREHIQKCIRHGWVRVDPNNSARYTIVSQYQFNNPAGKKNVLAIAVDDEFILTTNWKNISRFRAFLQEAENHRYIRHRKFRERKEAHSFVTQRDHVPVRVKPKRKKGNGSTTEQPFTGFACGLASSLTGISSSTASHYRYKLGSQVTYSSNRHVYQPALPGCEDYIDELNRQAAQAEDISKHGRYYISWGRIIFNGVSFRSSSLLVKRIRLKG